VTDSAAVSTLRIGEVARLTGVTVEALRFYEREGLLPTSIRSTNGARRFPSGVVERVGFLRQAQAAGLTLRDIKHLLRLPDGRGRARCERMRAVLNERKREIDAKVGELQQFRETLVKYIAACERALAKSADCDCPTMGALQRSSVTPTVRGRAS
jgi:DNA-binding transcriptional MerR regulator